MVVGKTIYFPLWCKKGWFSGKNLQFFLMEGTRRAPTSYKWGCNPYKWPHKNWVTGVITLLKEVITPFITGCPPCTIKKPPVQRRLTLQLDMFKGCRGLIETQVTTAWTILVPSSVRRNGTSVNDPSIKVAKWDRKTRVSWRITTSWAQKRPR